MQKKNATKRNVKVLPWWFLLCCWSPNPVCAAPPGLACPARACSDPLQKHRNGSSRLPTVMVPSQVVNRWPDTWNKFARNEISFVRVPQITNHTRLTFRNHWCRSNSARHWLIELRRFRPAVITMTQKQTKSVKSNKMKTMASEAASFQLVQNFTKNNPLLSN